MDRRKLEHVSSHIIAQTFFMSEIDRTSPTFFQLKMRTHTHTHTHTHGRYINKV